METSSIVIKTGNNSLARISKQVAIVNKLLANANHDRIIQFLLKNELFTLRLLSVHFQLDEQLLSMYSDDFDWREISLNKNVKWSKDLARKFTTRFDWFLFSKFSKNPYELISFGEVNWKGLVQNENFNLDISFIDSHLSQIDFDSLSLNLSFSWTFNIVEQYKDKWKWEWLSTNPNLPWSEELIEKYSDKLVWRSLSYNRGIPWTVDLVEKYKGKWNWSGLCINPSFPWSVSLIEKYWDELDFGKHGLSKNEGLNWSLEFLKRYKRHWNEDGLSKNEGIVWTEGMINEVRSWGYTDINPYSNENSPWSIDYILMNYDILELHEVYQYETLWINVFKTALDFDTVKNILNTFRSRKNYRSFSEQKQYDKLFPPFLDYTSLNLYYDFGPDAMKVLEDCFNEKYKTYQFINSEKAYQEFQSGKLQLSDLNKRLAEANNYEIHFNMRNFPQKEWGKLIEDYLERHREIMAFLSTDITLPEYFYEINTGTNGQSKILNWFKNRFSNT